MWCPNCNIREENNNCSVCGDKTQMDIPTEVYFCHSCKVPVIKEVDAIDKNTCTLCNGETKYLSRDLKPVFPEERLLIEGIIGEPFKYQSASVWNDSNRYMIDGNIENISIKNMKETNIDDIKSLLESNNDINKENYKSFNEHIDKFLRANQSRLNALINEAHQFVKDTAKDYKREHIIVSFSGGKDSTVTSDVVIKALSDAEIMHIFGDTTLEFPETIEYIKRFKRDNPLVTVREAKNKEQDFYEMCNEIGPPSRVMRWCCTMFKTGPINRRINAIYKNQSILTFYGIRKYESASRSKYERVSKSPKIVNQKVASPIFHWKDIDIWLYMFAEKIDFNDAYRYGYDRVGCWCCPNNSERSQFLSKVYMAEDAEAWRNYLVDFAKKIGKSDAEEYIDSGNWKARQGGYGIEAAKDVKIVSKNCTLEENARIFQLSKPLEEDFYNYFVPFGKVSKEMGRKMLDEVVVLDKKTNEQIISIQPKKDEFNHSVKIVVYNANKPEELLMQIGYQVRKYNACRACLGCESVCPVNAIRVREGDYFIDPEVCTGCKKCVQSKHLEYGCLMGKYLFSAASKEGK